MNQIWSTFYIIPVTSLPSVSLFLWPKKVRIGRGTTAFLAILVSVAPVHSSIHIETSATSGTN